MPDRPFQVSVTNPLTPAFEKVRRLLFEPFDLGKWFILGFCVWLAQLGRFGGGGTGFRFDGRRSIHAAIAELRDYVLNNLNWILPLASLLFVLALAVWLAFTWLSSRGQFMVLHDVATGRM